MGGRGIYRQKLPAGPCMTNFFKCPGFARGFAWGEGGMLAAEIDAHIILET